MAELYYPFESVNTGTASEPVYDRAITAEDERTFNKLRYTNGVFSSVGSGLSVSANNNMTVTVGTGGAHIEGALYYNSAPIGLTVEAANASLNRIDRVVLQFNTSVSVRSVRALIRTGTAATNPVAPELRRESNLYEIALADIYVKKGATGISQRAITDQRLNSALCGFVAAAIPSSVDTTGLFDQYQTALNEWLDTVAAALDGTLAGNLQNQITALGVRVTAEEDKIQPLDKGGTGATTAAAAREAILENKALSIAQGGTGKTTAAEAREALGITGGIISDVTQTNNSRIFRTIKYENGDMEQYMWGSNISMTFVAIGNRFMDFVTFDTLEEFANPSKIFIYGSCESNAGIAFLYANAFDNGSKKAVCYFDCPTAGTRTIENLTIYAKGRWK